MSKSHMVVAKQRIMPLSYTRSFRSGREYDESIFLEGIRDHLGPETYSIPIGRARMGIYLLAKLAINGERRRVLMSPFTIPDIVTMVVLAGAVPVFYDFESGSTAASLESLKALIDDRTAAIIVTHYHINERGLSEITALARFYGAYVFDDCALAFGGSIGGRPIGTLTDASVFSFSSFKLLNYFWGGLITTQNAHLAERIQEIVGGWPRLSGRDYQGAIKGCIRYDIASRPLLFNWLIFPLIQKRFRKSPASNGLEHIRIETESINPSLTSRPALIAFKEWASKLERTNDWLTGRRTIARIYRQTLSPVMVGADTPEDVIEGSCFTNFPILVPLDRYSSVIQALMLAGFDVGRALYPNVHRHPKFTSVSGHSENIDQMVGSTIYLPTHFGVTTEYAQAIASKIAEELDS